MNLQLLDRILAQPWAMRRESLALLTQLIIGPESKHPKAGQLEDKSQARSARCSTGYTTLSWEGHSTVAGGALPAVPDGVTVILVWGVLGRGWTSFERFFLDAIEVDELVSEIKATPEGSTVILWYRSPGGIATGVPELGEAQRALGETRKIIAFTDDLCASAAYWSAAQCSSIIATPTANLGSIGVYIAFYDWTQYLEKIGIQLELFKAGRLKAMGLPGNPLSDEEERYFQSWVDEAYSQFTAAVLANREIPTEAMQGQTLRGAEAQAANLVDQFFPSAEEFMEALRRGEL